MTERRVLPVFADLTNRNEENQYGQQKSYPNCEMRRQYFELIFSLIIVFMKVPQIINNCHNS